MSSLSRHIPIMPLIFISVSRCFVFCFFPLCSYFTPELTPNWQIHKIPHHFVIFIPTKQYLLFFLWKLDHLCTIEIFILLIYPHFFAWPISQETEPQPNPKNSRLKLQTWRWATGQIQGEERFSFFFLGRPGFEAVSKKREKTVFLKQLDNYIYHHVLRELICNVPTTQSTCGILFFG